MPVGSGLTMAARTRDGEGGTAALLGWTEGLWREVAVVQLHCWPAMAVVLAKDKAAKGERESEARRAGEANEGVLVLRILCRQGQAAAAGEVGHPACAWRTRSRHTLLIAAKPRTGGGRRSSHGGKQF